MRLQKFFPVFAVLFIFIQVSLGQEFKEDENWIGTIEFSTPPFLSHSLQKYTKEDVIKAKEKLNLIKQAPTLDEWEGTYGLYGELSDSKLLWNPRIGFINYHIYTCAIELRMLNYGRAVNSPDSVILITEKPEAPFFGMDKTGQVKLIKVKWGDLHFLVEEADLELFCELAAGYYGAAKTEKFVENGESYVTQTGIWNSFWTKNAGGQNKKAFGLPVLPKAYEKFIKSPIETRIISIGKTEKDPPTEVPVMTFARHYVKIGAGKNKGIKVGMEFYVPDLDDRIRIVKIKEKTSVAVMESPLDSETREEACINESGEDRPCKPFKVGMKIKTVPDEFLEND